MAFETIGLRAVLEGASAFLRDLDKIEKAEKDAGRAAEDTAKKTDKFGSMVTKVSTAAALGFAGLAVVATKFAMDFEQQLDQVGAVAQASEQDMEQLRQTALKLGADTAFSASDAAAAMEELAAGGRSVAQIVGGEAAASVALAAAGNYGLAESARTIATAMDVWKGTQIQTNDVVNRLAGAANASRFGVEDMSAAIAQGGGVAAAVGVSFEDFSTGIAAVASSFASGSDAGTSFKTFLLNLDGTTDKAKETIKQYGLEFRTATGELKPMSAIVQELHDKILPLGEAQQVAALKTIFGNDAYRTAAGLMKLTGEEFQTMSDKMGATDAADVAAQRMGNLSGDLEALKGSLETLAIQIGSSFLPILAKLAQGGADVANAFGSLPASTQTMTLGVIALAAAMPALVSAGSKVVTVFAAMRTGAISAKLAMAGVTLGLGALLIGLDLLSQKTTGVGVMDRVFGDVSKIEAAEEAVRKFDGALKGAGPEADKTAVAMNFLKRTTEDYTRAGGEALNAQSAWNNVLLGSDDRIFGFDVGLSKGKDSMKQFKEEVKAAAVALTSLPLEEQLEIYKSLPPELAKVFDEVTNITAAVNSQEYTMQQAAKTTDGWQGSLGLLGSTISDTATGVAGLQVTSSSVADFLGNSWGPALRSVFMSVGEDGQEELRNLAAEFPSVGTSADDLAEYLESNFGPEVAKAFEDLVKNTEESFENVRDAIESVLPSVDETFAEWKERLDQMVTDQQNWKGNLTLIWDAMKSAGVAMPEAILAAIAEKGPAFAANFAKSFAEDPEGALRALAVVAPAVMGQTADSITAEIIGAAPGVTTAVEVGINQPMEAALIAGEETARAAARLQHDAAIDAFLSDPGAATGAGTTIGSQFADGISSGIANTAANVQAAVTNLISGLFITATGPEGIESGSPSRRAARDIGAPFIDGIIEGMEAETEFLLGTTRGMATELVSNYYQAMQEEQLSGLGAVLQGFNLAAKESDFRARMIEDFGDLGGAVAISFNDALVNQTASGGKALFVALDKLIAEAEEIGVEGAGEAGQALIAAFAAAIETGSPDLVATALGMLDVFEDEIAVKAKEVGGTLAENFLAGYNEERKFRDLEGEIGRSGASFVEALQNAIENETPGAVDAMVRGASDIVDVIVETFDPSKASALTSSFFAAINAAIAGGGQAAIDTLVGILDEINNAANPPNVVGGGGGGSGGGSGPSSGLGSLPTDSIAAGTNLGLQDAAELAAILGVSTNQLIGMTASQFSQALAEMDGHQIVAWNRWSANNFDAATNLSNILMGDPSAYGFGRMPVFHSGIEYVPRTGPAWLQRGERVVSAADNMSAGGGTGSTLVLDVHDNHFTGTEDRNVALMRQMIHDEFSSQSGRSALIHGISRR